MPEFPIGAAKHALTVRFKSIDETEVLTFRCGNKHTGLIYPEVSLETPTLNAATEDALWIGEFVEILNAIEQRPMRTLPIEGLIVGLDHRVTFRFVVTEFGHVDLAVRLGFPAEAFGQIGMDPFGEALFEEACRWLVKARLRLTLDELKNGLQLIAQIPEASE